MRASGVTAARVLVNMIEGKMLVEFEATDRETLEQWLKSQGFHCEWVMHVELESQGGRLVAV